MRAWYTRWKTKWRRTLRKIWPRKRTERNSNNEEESEQVEYDEKELHDNDKTNWSYLTRFDVATWTTPMPDDLGVEIFKTRSEP